MPNTAILTFTACLTWCVLANVAAAADPANGLGNKSWLGFRGDGTSHASSSAPEKLEIGDDGNLAWKLKMPGRSVAGPIVIGDLVVTLLHEGRREALTEAAMRGGGTDHDGDRRLWLCEAPAESASDSARRSTGEWRQQLWSRPQARNPARLMDPRQRGGQQQCWLTPTSGGAGRS